MIKSNFDPETFQLFFPRIEAFGWNWTQNSEALSLWIKRRIEK